MALNGFCHRRTSNPDRFTKVKSFVQVIDVTDHQVNDLILIRIYHSAILLAVAGDGIDFFLILFLLVTFIVVRI